MRKLKKITSVIMSVALISSSLNIMTKNVNAANYVSGNYEYILEGDEAIICEYFGSDANLTIPSKLDTYTVKAIADSAFKKNNYIETLTIPETIRSIGYDAFSNCENLKEVKFNAVNCDGPVSSVFGGCSSLTKVEIGANVTSIGTYMFNGVPITSITIPSSVKKIESNAFAKSGLTSITIPETIESIGYSAFSDCLDLKEVKFNAINCDGPVSPVFAGCSSLTKVEIGPMVTTIGSYMFREVPITSITIPESVIEIENSAFEKSGLRSVTIPETIESIGYSAFNNCRYLGEVKFNATNCDGPVSAVFAGCDVLKKVIIGPNVTTIGTYMFNGVPITSITIPSSVKKIESNAFAKSGLRSITIPESIESIGYNAFSNCDKLSEVKFNAINCDGPVAAVFPGCTELKNVIIGSKVKVIGSNMFKSVPIKVIEIGSKVTEIGNEAFEKTELEKITIPESLKKVGYEAFSGCDSLKNVYYKGTKEAWAKINVSDDGNDNFIRAKIHYGKINVVKTKILTATKKLKASKAKISFKKINGATNYIVQISTSKNFKKLLVNKKVKKANVTVTSAKLKGKKKLYVRVKVYRKYNGKMFESRWSATKKIKIN